MHRIRFHFTWPDCWIGWYWDRNKVTLNVCLLPMCVISICLAWSGKRLLEELEKNRISFSKEELERILDDE